MKITAMFWYLWSTPLVFSIRQQHHPRYDPARLQIKQDSKAHDAPVNLPHQPLAAPVSKDAATYKLLPHRLPVARSKDTKVDAAHRHLPQKPLTRPASKDDAAYEVLPPRSPIPPPHVLSDVRDDYYEDESLPYFDEDNEDSPYPGVVEEYVTDEEVREANDEIQLTDEFLTSYLSNEDLEDLDTENEKEGVFR